MEDREEPIEKEEIIDNFIETIRNISELSDDDIESVIKDTIEEDDQFLDVLVKFLQKGDKIKEKLEFEKEIEEGVDEEKSDIVNAFESIDDAYSIDGIMERLRESGNDNPESVILDSLEDLLYIDNIDEDGTVYIALTPAGERLWESMK